MVQHPALPDWFTLGLETNPRRPCPSLCRCGATSIAIRCCCSRYSKFFERENRPSGPKICSTSATRSATSVPPALSFGAITDSPRLPSQTRAQSSFRYRLSGQFDITG